MQIKIKKQFLKDLSKIPKEYRETIEKLTFEIFPNDNDVEVIKRLSQMHGYDGYYKIRCGNYRIGIFLSDNILEFQRVLHRKEIYRFFP